MNGFDEEDATPVFGEGDVEALWLVAFGFVVELVAATLRGTLVVADFPPHPAIASNSSVTQSAAQAATGWHLRNDIAPTMSGAVGPGQAYDDNVSDRR
jgi:hypothetical protein